MQHFKMHFKMHFNRTEFCGSIQYFARFWLRYDVPDPSSPPELLVVHQSYSQSIHMVYLAPLKLAVVDAEGTMRLHYWPKNDLLKGPALPPAKLALGEADTASGERVIVAPLNNRNGTILEGKLATCGAGGAMVFHSVPAPPALAPPFPPVASPPPPPPPPLPVDYEIAVDAALLMTVSTITAGGSGGGGRRTVLDTFDRGMPVPVAGAGCTFKLLLRGSMVELYVNDVLTAPIALPNTISPGGHTEDGGWAEGIRAPAISVGLSGEWAKATLEGWTMGVTALFPQS